MPKAVKGGSSRQARESDRGEKSVESLVFGDEGELGWGIHRGDPWPGDFKLSRDQRRLGSRAG